MAWSFLDFSLRSKVIHKITKVKVEIVDVQQTMLVEIATAYIAIMNHATQIAGDVLMFQKHIKNVAAEWYQNTMKYNVANMFLNTIAKLAANMNQNTTA